MTHPEDAQVVCMAADRTGGLLQCTAVCSEGHAALEMQPASFQWLHSMRSIRHTKAHHVLVLKAEGLCIGMQQSW